MLVSKVLTLQNASNFGSLGRRRGGQNHISLSICKIKYKSGTLWINFRRGVHNAVKIGLVFGDVTALESNIFLEYPNPRAFFVESEKLYDMSCL